MSLKHAHLTTKPMTSSTIQHIGTFLLMKHNQHVNVYNEYTEIDDTLLRDKISVLGRKRY